jgi:hypothetical protein
MTEAPIYVQRSKLIERGFNPDAKLPRGLTIAGVRTALDGLYDYLHALNAFLVSRGYDRLEETFLGNAFSGFISELMVRNLSGASEILTRNTMVGGHPDLVPRGVYPEDAVLHGEQGVELKATIKSSGWQGHNKESSWIMVVQYAVDIASEPVMDRCPTEILKVMAAKLEKEDWKEHKRREDSRRTATSLILASGTAKLKANAIYTHPQYVSARDRMNDQLRKLHIQAELFDQDTAIE